VSLAGFTEIGSTSVFEAVRDVHILPLLTDPREVQEVRRRTSEAFIRVPVSFRTEGVFGPRLALVEIEKITGITFVANLVVQILFAIGNTPFWVHDTLPIVQVKSFFASRTSIY
jgi:hypothetical protein